MRNYRHRRSMIWNFGSINIDHVYRLQNLPKPGETLSAQSYMKFLGGKGLNQSVAIAQSGGDVRHVGAVGPDGTWAINQMEAFGVSVRDVASIEVPTGNAVIYVDAAAENQIVILGGANQALAETQINAAIDEATQDDIVLFQNEINNGSLIGKKAKEKGLKLAYSAAPFDKEAVLPLLPQLDILAVNETEAADLAKATGKNVEALGLPMLLVTKGSLGSELFLGNEKIEQMSFSVEPKDTTGAGDTFLGAFLAYFDKGESPKEALRFAAAASALQVTKEGAAQAIPNETETLEFLKAQNG